MFAVAFSQRRLSVIVIVWHKINLCESYDDCHSTDYTTHAHMRDTTRAGERRKERGGHIWRKSGTENNDGESVK